MYKAGIIISSDSSYAGKREDLSGPVIKEVLKDKGYKVEKSIILPDSKELLEEEMKHMADELNLDLILTTGGTGFSKRDVTPEATIEVCHRMANGISEAIRNYSLTITPRAMLSRAVSGIRGETLIINLPGSPKAVRESLEYIIGSLDHGLDVLKGQIGECGG